MLFICILYGRLRQQTCQIKVCFVYFFNSNEDTCIVATVCHVLNLRYRRKLMCLLNEILQCETPKIKSSIVLHTRPRITEA